MCGIAGVMTSGREPPADNVLDDLSVALAHRGPDGEGRHLARSVGLVQRRLAIIDLETGDQPLFDNHGAALVANGEIYNYIELSAVLDDGQLATRSDCEPPLHLYRKFGLDFARQLRGMYAIAIHDPGDDHLVLARDPFGIKPLYYTESGDRFAFASEPQALIAAGLASRAVSDGARTELLQLQFTTGRDTIFRDIKRVLPGETLVVRRARVVERRRLAALPDEGPESCSDDDALARIDAALMDTVRFHQRSDVPYGMFLSGGVDSTALLAVMTRLNERPVRAFTAGFDTQVVPDERAHARTVAQALGADHDEIMISDGDFWNALPAITAAVDDPCADYAIVPTYLLARSAGRDLKVILCGEGGDEMFGGYGRYRSALRPWWRGGRPMRSRGVFDRVNVLRDLSPAWRDGLVADESTSAAPGRSRLQVAQAVDCADWLPNDLLVKLDRCLMSHGVEGRTPFLDTSFARTAFCLPDRLKVQRGYGKWLLRIWLEKALPIARPFHRKRGFTVPVGHWILQRGESVGALVAAQPAIREICRPNLVPGLFKTAGKRSAFASWILLYYALWHRHHVLGLANDGDVFDCLSASAER